MGLKYDDLIPEEREDVQKVRAVSAILPPTALPQEFVRGSNAPAYVLIRPCHD